MPRQNTTRCCELLVQDTSDLAKAIHHMETLKVRRLPVINKSKRMVGMISLGDVGQAATVELAAQYIKSVSAHH
jgi:predicted transcriptional regulator